ncbi:hypothetical protein GW17_00053932 [Ensete ventricosum]|nr:hypothetical protein GW17_00053932 [Ensete ventricosum]
MSPLLAYDAAALTAASLSICRCDAAAELPLGHWDATSWPLQCCLFASAAATVAFASALPLLPKYAATVLLFFFASIPPLPLPLHSLFLHRRNTGGKRGAVQYCKQYFSCGALA